MKILDEYQETTQADPGFDPVRPVVATNVRPPERDVKVPLISDPLTARVTDLFNVGYEVLLQIFERFFAHTEETGAQLQVLADATIGLMLRVIKPLGDLITTLPVGGEQPGLTTGPSFELFYETDYLMPHRDAAWALLTERLDEAAWLCDELQRGRGARIGDQLTPVLTAIREIAQTLAAHLPESSTQARQARQAVPLAAAEASGLLTRAAEFAQQVAAVPVRGAAAAGLADVFGLAYAALTTAAAAPPGATPATVLPRLTDSVLRPLADALAASPAGSDGEAGSPVSMEPGPQADAGGRRAAGAGPSSGQTSRRGPPSGQ